MRTYLKAVVGSLLAALAALQVALNVAGDGPVEVTAVEWVGVAIAGLVTLSGVYQTPNQP